MKKDTRTGSVDTDINFFAYVILTVNLVLRLLVALRPLKFIDGLTIPDDAYLSLNIARNIAKGLGPMFGSDYTNGFQPLYVFIMTPVYWLFPHDLVTPVHIALVLLAVADTLALYFLIKLVMRHSKNQATAIFAGILWLANPYVMATTANGLETMISVFLIIYTLYYASGNLIPGPSPKEKGVKQSGERQKVPSPLERGFRGEVTGSFSKGKGVKQSSDRQNVPSPLERGFRGEIPGSNKKTGFILGILLGLCAFARIDNLIFVFAFMAAATYIYLIDLKQYRLYFTSIVYIALGFIIAYAPWLIYSLAYTGDIYPVSGKAIRMISLSEVNYRPGFMNLYFPMIVRAFQVLIHFNKILLLVAALLACLVIYKYGFKTFRQRLFANRLYLTTVISIVVLVLSYIFYNYAFWFFPRYFFPVVLPLILYSCLLFDQFLSGFRKPYQRYITATFFILVAIGGNLMIPELKPLFFSKNDRDMGYMNLGLWAEKSFPDSTIIGSPQTGALSYFAVNKKVINLDGVVNKPCYEAIRQKKLMSYIRDKEIQYVIGWADNISFIKKNSANINDSSLVLVRKIDDFKSWNYEWFVYRTKQSWNQHQNQ